MDRILTTVLLLFLTASIYSKPVLTFGCGASLSVTSRNTREFKMNAIDGSSGNLSWSISGPSGLTGPLTVDSNGLVTFSPMGKDQDFARPIVATVTVSDGFDSISCDIKFTVIPRAPYVVSIEPGEGFNDICQCFFHGYPATLNVVLEGIDPNEGIGSFDFLIAYDNTAMAFQSVVAGEMFTPSSCNLEQFSYRHGDSVKCSGGCPSGLLRISGVAKLQDKAAGNRCSLSDPAEPTVLAELTFLVSNDRTLDCTSAPIRFFWSECGDNILSDLSGSQLYLSNRVYDYLPKNVFGYIGSAPINIDRPLPTNTGAPNSCLNETASGKEPAIRKVDFINGSVRFPCNSIDFRGDINLNGIEFEIADAIVLTNYFIDGLSALGSHPEGSIASSDVNADGIALSIADLVYLIRVAMGDALPYPKTNPVSARWDHESGLINVYSDMGAAFIVVSGNQTPNLLAGNMEMKSRFDGTNTRILVYSYRPGQTFSGSFLAVDGNIVSIEMATYDGLPVIAKKVMSD